MFLYLALYYYCSHNPIVSHQVSRPPYFASLCTYYQYNNSASATNICDLSLLLPYHPIHTVVSCKTHYTHVCVPELTDTERFRRLHTYKM